MRTLLLSLSLLVSACSIETRTYSEDDTAIDAAADAPPPGAQEILVDGASTIPLTVEEGAGETFEVTLRYPPEGSLAVVVTEDDAALATVDPAALTFDDTNYDVPQLVTITGTQDGDDEPETTSVSLTAPDAVAATVEVTVNDDESQAVLVSLDEANIVEGGSVQIGVTLRFPPAGTVTVALSSDDTMVATVTPAELMFTAANYDQPQDVTVVAAQDVNTVQDVANITATLVGATTGTTVVTVPDNDSLGFVVSTLNLTVNENGTGTNTFTVELSNMPSQSVVAALAPVAAGIYTLTPDTLTFNGVNWDDPQTVTVTAVGDPDDVDEATQARVTATDVTTGTVNVTIEDTTQIINFGWPTWFNRFTQYGSGVLHAYKMQITGTTPVTLDKWGVITSSAGATMAEMAIYTNGASGPGNLITSSGAFAANVGQFDVPDTTNLSPGTYWLAIKLSGNVSLGESTTATAADAYCNKTATWATALPAAWGAPTCFPQYFLNIYLVTYR